MAADTVAKISASVIDDEGIRSTVLSHLYIDAGQTVNQIKAAAAAWAHAVDQVSAAKIESLRFEVQLPDVVTAQRALYVINPATGIKAAAAADSEVQEVGVFDFTQSGLPYRYGQVIPALREALTSGGPVNTADPTVDTLVNLLKGGVLGGTYTGLNTAPLVALSRAFRGDRKHRRALFAKSVKNL